MKPLRSRPLGVEVLSKMLRDLARLQPVVHSFFKPLANIPAGERAPHWADFTVSPPDSGDSLSATGDQNPVGTPRPSLAPQTATFADEDAGRAHHDPYVAASTSSEALGQTADIPPVSPGEDTAAGTSTPSSPTTIVAGNGDGDGDGDGQGAGEGEDDDDGEGGGGENEEDDHLSSPKRPSRRAPRMTKDVQQPEPRVTNNRKRKRTEATITVSPSLPKPSSSSMAAIMLQRCSPDCTNPCGSKRVTVKMWHLLQSQMEFLRKGLQTLGLQDQEAANLIDMMCTPLVEAAGPTLDAVLARPRATALSSCDNTIQ